MKKKSSICFIMLLSIVSYSQQTIDTTKIFGVTIDDPWTNVSDITDAFSSNCIKPTARIVFDEGQHASDYYAPVTQIAPSCFIMGELLDSYYVPNYTVSQYLNRTTEYLDVFENIVDIWEIGNEVNGDWLGNTDSVVAKIEGAYNLVKIRGKKTSLTLYFNRDCFYNNPQNEMFTWINNIPTTMKQGLDYVMVSYYEDDCGNVILSQNEWQSVFDSLHVLFPNSKLAMGECGTTDTSKKAEYMNRYYNMNIATPKFVGGYFWWYYKQDCVPKTKELWDTLNKISCNNILTAQVKELNLNDLILFPNPTTGNISIKSNCIIKNLDIYNIQGVLIKKSINQDNIFIGDNPKGIYFLQITTDTEIKKIKILLE
ncbi:MAG: T9SS type A sorting domain-containing protein [Crocinitomicaceae bacterium]